MAVSVKVVVVSALVVASSLVAATAPVATAVEAPARMVMAAARVSGSAAADLLSVPVDLSSLAAGRAGSGPAAGGKATEATHKEAAWKEAAARKTVTGANTTPAKLPACEPLNVFLSTYYRMAWRLAMHTPTAKGAFEVFVLARRHAAKYVAVHPHAKPVVVCDIARIVAVVLPKVVAIMRQHEKVGGALPLGRKYRSMTHAEATAMRKALAVPLAKPLPWWVVPKSVPMFV